MATITMTASHNFSLLTISSADTLVLNNFVCTLNANGTVGFLDGTKGGTLVQSANNSNFFLSLLGASRGTQNSNLILLSAAPGTLTLGAANATYTSAGGPIVAISSSNCVLTFNGSGTGGSQLNSAVISINSGNCTFTVNGTLTGGSTGGINNGAAGLLCGSTGMIGTVNGDLIGGTGAPGALFQSTGSGSLTVNGSVRGGSAGTSPGLATNATFALAGTVTGSAIGGSLTNCQGVYANSGSTTLLIGTAVGNGFGSGSGGLTACEGVYGAQAATIKVKAMQAGALGMAAVAGNVFMFSDTTVNFTTMMIAGGGGSVTLSGTGGSYSPTIYTQNGGTVTVSGGTLTTVTGNVGGNVIGGIGGTLSGGSTPSQIADAVWNATASSYTNAGTMGRIMRWLKAFIGG